MGSSLQAFTLRTYAFLADWKILARLTQQLIFGAVTWKDTSLVSLVRRIIELTDDRVKLCYVVWSQRIGGEDMNLSG